MQAKSQAVNEIPAITRHLQEAINKYANKIVFSVFVAPSIHPDTIYMTEFSKSRYNVDIVPLTIKEFISKIKSSKKMIDLLSN